MNTRFLSLRLFVLGTCAVCLLFTASGHSYASAPREQLYDPRIADYVTPADFARESAVVLVDRRIHMWSFDETTIERSFAVKILTHEGIELFGDFISDTFHDDFYDYRIEAVVVSPRGERTSVASNDIRKLELGRKEYQYRTALPGLEPGSIIEIVESVKSAYPITFGRWNFSHRVPTLRSELIFKVPRGAIVSFNFTPKSSRVSPASETGRRYETHTITMETLPPYVDEPYMPRRHIGNPSVYYNIWQVTMEDYLRFKDIDYDDRLVKWMRKHEIPWELPLVTKSWRKVADAFAEYFDPRSWEEEENADEYGSILHAMMDRMPDPGSGDFVAALDSILLVFHNEFQSVGGNFRFKNPEASLEEREGNPFESAYILKRILEELNIQPTVVLTGDAAYREIDKRNADPSSIRHTLLLVSGGKKQYWIDPSASCYGVGQISWEYQGVEALWIKWNDKYSFITTPMDDAPENCISRREEIEIEPGGRISGRARIILTGQYLFETRDWIESRHGGMSTENIPGFMSTLYPDEIRFTDVAVEKNGRDTMVVSCSYSMDNFGQQAGGFMNLDFSEWCDDPRLAVFHGDYRMHDVSFPFPSTRMLTLDLIIPDGYTVASRPDNARQENACLSCSRSCIHDGNRITIERVLSILNRTVDKEEYGETKNIIRGIRELDEESIMLKRSS
jgi:hypothetical protein